MSGQLPEWLATEERVRRLFRCYGFSVESVSIAGRQIDLIASRADAFSFGRDIWVIEITTEKVGAAKGGVDSQKLQLAKKERSGARMMLISTTGFTDDQRATLERLEILPKTYAEFEAAALDLERYATAALAGLKDRPASDIGYNPSAFIEPVLVVQQGETSEVKAEAWIEALVANPQPGLCALLGNLGSGKTSLLQRILERGAERFLEDPGNRAVPLYVPLGRYKQHSGNLEQMLMSEFSRTGHDTYPAALVNHFLETRRVILLLDGLDEIHPIQNSDDVLETVTAILQRVGSETTAVLTCRRQFGVATKKWTLCLGCQGSMLLMQRFEVCRADIAQRRVLAVAVVEGLDVLGDGLTRLADRRPWSAMDEVLLQGREEAFDDGVIPAVALSAHAADDAVFA
jgi:hypothetical protein